MNVSRASALIQSPFNWFCKKPTGEELYWKSALQKEESTAIASGEKLIPSKHTQNPKAFSIFSRLQCLLSRLKTSKPAQNLTLVEVKQLVIGYWTRRNQKTLKHLAGITSCIALAMFASPLFSFGVGAGSVSCICLTIIGLAHFHIFHPKPAKSSPEKSEFGEPHITAWIVPCAEEIIFRLGIQGIIKKSIECCFVSASRTLSLVGMQFTVAQTIAILATSAIFGYSHTLNPNPFESKIHMQSLLATIGGIGKGILKEQFGLTASIAEHIAHNTLITLMVTLLRSNNLRKQKLACAAANTTRPSSPTILNRLRSYASRSKQRIWSPLHATMSHH